MALSPLPTEGDTMMVKVVCACGHSGVVNAETSPRSMTCSRCGSSRRVQAERGERIISTARREEWVAQLLGSRAVDRQK
jgi:hypothetical protein